MSRRVLTVTAVVLGLYIAGCIALTHGAKGFYQRFPVSGTSTSRDAGVSSGSHEGEMDPEVEPYVEDATAILVGVSSAFFAFWRLQRGVKRRGRNVWLVVLAVSFVICVYGFGLLLELAAGV